MLLDLTSLPWLPLDRRNFFPARPAVYIAISGNGNILYIGRCEEVSSRWRSHEKLRHLKLLYGVRVAFLFTKAEKLHNIEATLIRKYQPLYNLRSEKLRLASEDGRVQFLRSRLEFGLELWERGLLRVFSQIFKLVQEVQTYTKKLAKHFISAPAEEQEKLVWWFSGLAELYVLGANLLDSIQTRSDARFLLRETIEKSEAKAYLQACAKPCPQDFAIAVAALTFEWKLFQAQNILKDN